MIAIIRAARTVLLSVVVAGGSTSPLIARLGPGGRRNRTGVA